MNNSENNVCVYNTNQMHQLITCKVDVLCLYNAEVCPSVRWIEESVYPWTILDPLVMTKTKTFSPIENRTSAMDFHRVLFDDFLLFLKLGK